MRRISLSYCLFLILLLSACAGGDQRTIHVEDSKPAVRQNYAYERWKQQERPRDFYSQRSAKPSPAVKKPPKAEPECSMYQKGLASWYGHELAGNKTANGEKFDPDGLTAAHRKLPFGTILKVTLDNGRGNPEGVYVRVNDRGPFVKGRIIDLSLGAAKKLGMKDTKDVHVYLCR